MLYVEELEYVSRTRSTTQSQGHHSPLMEMDGSIIFEEIRFALWTQYFGRNWQMSTSQKGVCALLEVLTWCKLLMNE